MKGKPTNQVFPSCSNSLNIDTFVPGTSINEPIEVQTDDVTFCFSCRTVLVFDEDLKIVIPGPEMLFYIISDPGFNMFISQIDNARKNKPSLN
jgi:hypothetical protein